MKLLYLTNNGRAFTQVSAVPLGYFLSYEDDGIRQYAKIPDPVGAYVSDNGGTVYVIGGTSAVINKIKRKGIK